MGECGCRLQGAACPPCLRPPRLQRAFAHWFTYIPLSDSGLPLYPGFLRKPRLCFLASPALPPGHLFSGVEPYHYWSSSSSAFRPGYAWHVDRYYGAADDVLQTFANYVWPVRGGQ